MRTSRLALAALLPAAVMFTAVLLTTACGTTAPVAGAAYGTTPAARISSPAQSASATSPATSPGSPGALGAPVSPARTVLTVAKTKIGYVLATGTGMTLYWYSHDVKGGGASTCTGGCLAAWPALAGTPVAAAGVRLAGKLGTITRPGGVVQATYDGYPLYTFSADKTPDQTTGNGVGGVWHVFTGAALSPSPAAASAASARDLAAGGGAAAAPATKLPAKPSAVPSTTMTG